MDIKDAVRALEVKAVRGSGQGSSFHGISSDSRQVRPGYLFVAERGAGQDGHAFIRQALERGAQAVVLEDERFLPSPDEFPNAAFIVVKDSRRALVALGERFFGYPCRRLKIAGVTGTNGKTSVTYLAKSILDAAGRSCGLIGTIGQQIRRENLPLKNTTPGSLELREIFRDMADAGDEYVVMEVSSHALHQGRILGVPFSAAVFTNLTQDHLDYHKNFDEYFRAKARLFLEHLTDAGCAVINRDDDYGKKMISLCPRRVLTYGLQPGADVTASRYSLSAGGTRIFLEGVAGEGFEVQSALIGVHNIYNVLAAAALAFSLGVSRQHIRAGIESLACVPGRLERIPSSSGIEIFVDYAHTDDALKNVLESLRAIAHNGRIITVFGCGGDRDRGKRPKMGRVASMLSDVCLITSDNPRSEDPKAIAEQIVSGIAKNNFEIELDRFKAISRAVEMALPGDIVLVAGKGHETSQIVGEQVLPFDDRDAVRRVLKNDV